MREHTICDLLFIVIEFRAKGKDRDIPDDLKTIGEMMEGIVRDDSIKVVF